MLELEIDRKCLNYNENFKFMPFGKKFILMPFGNYAIWEVTNLAFHDFLYFHLKLKLKAVFFLPHEPSSDLEK